MHLRWRHLRCAAAAQRPHWHVAPLLLQLLLLVLVLVQLPEVLIQVPGLVLLLVLPLLLRLQGRVPPGAHFVCRRRHLQRGEQRYVMQWRAAQSPGLRGQGLPAVHPTMTTTTVALRVPRWHCLHCYRYSLLLASRSPQRLQHLPLPAVPPLHPRCWQVCGAAAACAAVAA